MLIEWDAYDLELHSKGNYNIQSVTLWKGRVEENDLKSIKRKTTVIIVWEYTNSTIYK